MLHSSPNPQDPPTHLLVCLHALLTCLLTRLVPLDVHHHRLDREGLPQLRGVLTSEAQVVYLVPSPVQRRDREG